MWGCFMEKKLKYDEFSKNLCKHHFWLVGQCGKNLFRQALLHTTYVDTLKQLSCKISAKLAEPSKVMPLCGLAWASTVLLFIELILPLKTYLLVTPSISSSLLRIERLLAWNLWFMPRDSPYKSVYLLFSPFAHLYSFALMIYSWLRSK